MKRQIESRCGATVAVGIPDAQFTVELGRDASLPAESFDIAAVDDTTVRITGADDRGVLYGIGKWLRTGRYESTGFVPGTWQGTSVPAKTWRAMYFATHFHNFYQQAPIADITNYVEDLALWGDQYDHCLVRLSSLS